MVGIDENFFSLFVAAILCFYIFYVPRTKCLHAPQDMYDNFHILLAFFLFVFLFVFCYFFIIVLLVLFSSIVANWFSILDPFDWE